MFKKELFWLGLILAVIFLLPWLSTFLKIPGDFELIKLFELNKCIQDKQIPCRWISGISDSYGYPLFNYQAPLPYYFGEAIYLLTNSFAFAVKAMFITGLAGAYIFLYIFASKLLQKNARILSAYFYTIAAYFIIYFFPDIALGQVWGMMFFPLILLSIMLLFQKNSLQNILIFILSSALLILSSNNFLFFLFLIFLWIIYQYILSKNTMFFLTCLVCLLFSFLLSAFYSLPFILERNLVRSVFAFDYLPRTVKERPQTADDSKYQILTGESRIYDFQQGSNWFKFKTETKTHTIIRISQYYFPQWKILVDGKTTNVEYTNNSLGLMTIILGEGNHIIEGKLFNTPVRSISNLLSVAFFFIVLLLSILQFKKVRQWLAYYRRRID